MKTRKTKGSSYTFMIGVIRRRILNASIKTSTAHTKCLRIMSKKGFLYFDYVIVNELLKFKRYATYWMNHTTMFKFLYNGRYRDVIKI